MRLISLSILFATFMIIPFAMANDQSDATPPPDTAFSSDHNSIHDFVNSAYFQNLPFDEQLRILDQKIADFPDDISESEWVIAAQKRLMILAILGEFELGNTYLDDYWDRIEKTISKTDLYVPALYAAGFTYINVGKIEESLEVIEKIKRAPGFSENIGFQQNADTLMVALHTNIGNAISAADILIENYNDEKFTDLPLFEQFKVLTNISYALIEGEQYDMASEYIGIGRDRLELARQNKSLKPMQIQQVEWHLLSNAAKIHLKRKEYTELAAFVEPLTLMGENLGSSIMIVSAQHIKAAAYLGEANLRDAVPLMNDTVVRATALGANDLLINFYETQADILAASGDFEGALYAHLEARKVFDSINTQQSRARAEYMDARITLQEQNTQIEKLEAENMAVAQVQKRDRLILFICLFGFASLAAVTFSLFRSQQRLKASTRELSISERKANAATLTKSAFLANMSHEIRTPLNGLMGMAQVLADKDIPADQRENVDVIVSSGETLLTIVNDVLDLSKIEAGKMTVEEVPVDIHRLLNQLGTLWRTKAEEKGITLELIFAPELPRWIVTDPVRIRQCVSNLVSNAIKFTDKGSVTLTARFEKGIDDKGTFTCSVEDTGIGIEQSSISKLFTAFEQVDSSTTRRFGGTGLGLIITSELVSLMNGKLNVESTPGSGSVFTFKIETSEPKELPSQVFSTPGEAISSDALQCASGLRVLLVDDNLVNRLVAKAFLQDSSTEVVEAENGLEALRHLKESGRFDMVLLDMHMPVMDGPQTIKEIRNSDEPWKNIRVIALTADAMVGDRDRYIAMGSDAYLTKPLAKADLQNEISKLMTRKRVDINDQAA